MNKVNVIKQNLEFIGKTWIKCIGTFASILSLFFLFWTWDDIRITSTQYKCVIIILLCVLALILAILWTCIFKRTKTIWESPSGKIKVCYSDIMKDGFDKRNKEEKLFVIPVNSCFDTIVDEDISTCSKPLVSPNSLHGRWIKTMVNKGFTIEEIDNKIHNCLEMQNLVPKSIIADEDKERGKREVYELGTVAMIRGNNNSTFLLLAISEYDDRLSTKAQITNPWFTAQYNREREKLFLYACKLHKEFVISSKCMRHNIINLMIAWNVFDDCGERMKLADREEAMPYMLQSIFLLTPVISTTFASAQTFLGDVKKSGVLGTLIVDEAGQAQPQMAVGAMFRCRKAIIVGDPKQIEPVVTAETDMIKQLLTAEILAGYKDKKISVQAFADYINPYGTYLGKDEEKEWVGCPLVVHRRCIDPMYTISNVLSYDGTMKQQTAAPKEDRARTFILDKSCWIDVAGAENSGKKDHFVKAQGELVLKLLERKFERDPIDIPRLFIITPFTSVKDNMTEMIKKSELYGKEPRVRKWLNANNIGTVHTFQGQGTDEVIFLLGCDSKSMGAVNWVNNNIVNVAATRAKFRFYMIGDKSVWMCKPVRVARECTAEILTAKEVAELLGDKTEEAKSASAKMSMICPECGKKLVERSGKFGKFIGCSGFPKCRFTQSV